MEKSDEALRMERSGEQFMFDNFNELQCDQVKKKSAILLQPEEKNQHIAQ